MLVLAVLSIMTWLKRKKKELIINNSKKVKFKNDKNFFVKKKKPLNFHFTSCARLLNPMNLVVIPES